VQGMPFVVTLGIWMAAPSEGALLAVIADEVSHVPHLRRSQHRPRRPPRGARGAHPPPPRMSPGGACMLTAEEVRACEGSRIR
jgi:hypothetical protein